MTHKARQTRCLQKHVISGASLLSLVEMSILNDARSLEARPASFGRSNPVKYASETE